MSVNSPLTLVGEPILQPGEVAKVAQGGVQFQVESGGGYPGNMGSYYGRGNAYVTSRRMILVTSPLARHFQSLDFPFLSLAGEKLNSSLFASKTITGLVEPTPGGGLAGTGEWKITFSQGGADAFFQALSEGLAEARRDPSAFARAVVVAVAEAAALEAIVVNGMRAESRNGTQAPAPPSSPKAFIDPNDPLKVFVTTKGERDLPTESLESH